MQQIELETAHIAFRVTINRVRMRYVSRTTHGWEVFVSILAYFVATSRFPNAPQVRRIRAVSTLTRRSISKSPL
jgi:hypothetical protein